MGEQEKIPTLQEFVRKNPDVVEQMTGRAVVWLIQQFDAIVSQLVFEEYLKRYPQAVTAQTEVTVPEAG